ncbi:sulfite exporter TauE/SafE family protein [Paenibacillus hamazuiensis]|uniref:sulfite exporter TauE/SafE family protein n=1 Tax=Paenibacillus hamazuiensis TaxID=2936508 RepID=UPI00200FC162|nr:sulfite exporter TauE/SafE family protein [Paenibacillus hamazuiensis]
MLVGLILFIAVLVSTVSGFGSSLIAMPLLTMMIGVKEASPLVALVVLVQNVAIIVKYRHAFQWKDMALLCAGALLGVPFGVFALKALDEKVVLTALGTLLVLYSIYDLSGKPLPNVKRKWASLFGFAGGGLAGAYNTYGPPIIIYGNCRNWSPETSKSNVQLFGLLNSVFVISLHAYSHHYTDTVVHMFWTSAPFLAAALILGLSVDKYIRKAAFRKIVCVLLLAVGLKMIFSQ